METKTTPVFDHINWNEPAIVNNDHENYFNGTVTEELSKEDIKLFLDAIKAAFQDDATTDTTSMLATIAKVAAIASMNECVTKRDALFMFAGFKMGETYTHLQNPFAAMFR